MPSSIRCMRSTALMEMLYRTSVSRAGPPGSLFLGIHTCICKMLALQIPCRSVARKIEGILVKSLMLALKEVEQCWETHEALAE